MYSDLYFRIADLGMHVKFFDVSDGRKFLRTYAPFYDPSKSAPQVMDVEVGRDLVKFEAEGEFVGEFDIAGNLHVVYLLPDGGYKMMIHDIDGKAACAFSATKGFKEVKVSVFGDEATQIFGLNNALMISYSFATVPYHCLMLHSSVVMHEQRAYLFLGVSGTGKSTHSDLWCKYVPNTDILNDDNPVLRIVDGEVRIYGSPWSGKRNYYRQMYLRAGAFVDLEQAKVNEIERLKSLKAFSVVFSSTASMIWDKPTYRELCSTVSDVVSAVPVFHLKNLPVREAALMSYAHCTGKEME